MQWRFLKLLGMVKLRQPQADMLRICIGFVFVGLVMAAHSAHAGEYPVSQGKNVALAHPENSAPVSLKLGNTPQLPQTSGSKIDVRDKISPQLNSNNPADRQAGKNTSIVSARGEVILSNKNPKAAAMSLKEAILAMNADSDNYNRKFTK